MYLITILSSKTIVFELVLKSTTGLKNRVGANITCRAYTILGYVVIGCDANNHYTKFEPFLPYERRIVGFFRVS